MSIRSIGVQLQFGVGWDCVNPSGLTGFSAGGGAWVPGRVAAGSGGTSALEKGSSCCLLKNKVWRTLPDDFAFLPRITEPWKGDILVGSRWSRGALSLLGGSDDLRPVAADPKSTRSISVGGRGGTRDFGPCEKKPYRTPPRL